MTGRSIWAWVAIAVVAVIVVGGVVIGVSNHTSQSTKPAAVSPPHPSGAVALHVTNGKVAAAQTKVLRRGLRIGRIAIRWTKLVPHLTLVQVKRLIGKVAGADATVLKSRVAKVTSTNVKSIFPSTITNLKHGDSRSDAPSQVIAVQDDSEDQPDSVKEPSVASVGNTIFVTGNWFAAYTTNGGASWKTIDPPSTFGNDFCCDQVVQYDPARDAFFWLMQFDPNNGPGYLKLAISKRSDMFSNPCVYTFDGSSYGMSQDTDIDYNDMALTHNDLYITSNLTPPNNGNQESGIMRFSLDSLMNCPSNLKFQDFHTDQVFTLKTAEGASNVMYFGTNDINSETVGQYFRVYAWPDNSNTITHVDSKISSFGYENEGSAQCGSQDKVIKNWCDFNDSRDTGGAEGNGTVVYAFNANQNSSRPFPYIRFVSFNARTLKLLNSSDFYLTDAAVQFPSLASNSQGQIAGIFAFGGGTGSHHYYPGVGSFVLGQSNSVQYFAPGQGNACKDSEHGVYRWGDYLTIRGDGARWRIAGYVIEHGNCGSGSAYTQPFTTTIG